MSNVELARRTQLAPELVRRMFSVGGLNPPVGTLTAIADALNLELVPSSARLLSATSDP